jgi:hypothetical protein
MVDWADWWSWELELSPHVLKRMIDRQFTEADLRLMLENATGLRENHEEGRWVIETKLAGRPWEVIVEPIHGERVLLVVTAYPVD